MPCYGPIRAYKSKVRNPTGKRSLVFDPRKAHDGLPLMVPCGVCIGCQQRRAAHWAVRCLHESKMYAVNSFITLTYSDKCLPSSGSLSSYEFSKFLKRLRYARAGTEVRFFGCGEYGSTNFRPHYHALLFNCDFPDKRPQGANDQGDQLFSSKELEGLWPYGFNTIGTVSARSAAYVAKYMVKPGSPPHSRCEPPFQRMSRHHGIGWSFFNKYRDEIARDDFALMNGKEVGVPRYYDTLLEKFDECILERNKLLRKAVADANPEESTLKRLRAKEEFAEGSHSVFKRKL